MESTLGPWVAPILIIPGMALLVISTAHRYSQLLLHLASGSGEVQLAGQLRRVRWALIWLYLGVSVQAAAGLAGGLALLEPDRAAILMAALSCLGITCLLLASLILAIDLIRSPVAASK